MNTLDIINEIIANNPDIKSLYFFEYPKQELLQQRIDLNEKNNEFINVALHLRKKLKLPFRDALMLSFFDKKNVSKELLQNALIHNHNTNEIKTCDVEEIRNLLKSSPEKNLILNSKTNFNGDTVKHLFLLDFHIFPSENNLTIISNILETLGVQGYILNSGKSYHFISNSFFQQEDLFTLLAKSLMFAPIIDKAWIAHQLIERSCSLRVSNKHGVMPQMVVKI